jgi:hypothetical protein
LALLGGFPSRNRKEAAVNTRIRILGATLFGLGALLLTPGEGQAHWGYGYGYPPPRAYAWRPAPVYRPWYPPRHYWGPPAHYRPYWHHHGHHGRWWR